jgi:PilZ domain
MDERRNAPRIKVDLPVRWEGVLSQQQATITSLSTTGAFILSGGKVDPKELVRLEIDLPDQSPVYFWAEVVAAAYEIGFAVRFTSIEDDDQKRLVEFVAGELKRSKSK